MFLKSVRTGVQERRARAQLFRLVNRDFPWLWAIWPKWESSRDIVRVWNFDSFYQLGFEETLRQAERGYHEVWIHYRMADSGELVVKVDFESPQIVFTSPKKFQAHALHIAYVGRTSSKIGVEIVRPPATEGNFNSLIEEYVLKDS